MPQLVAAAPLNVYQHWYLCASADLGYNYKNSCRPVARRTSPPCHIWRCLQSIFS